MKLIHLFVLLLLFTSCGKGDLVDENVSETFFYSKDKTEIWYKSINAPDVTGLWDYEWIKVPADAQSFKIMEYGIGKDKNHIFRGTRILEDVDYETYSIDDLGVIRDKNNVYLPAYGAKLKVLKEDNPATYKKLKEWEVVYYVESPTYIWGKDDKHYFHKDTVFSVDYESFAILTTHIVADKNYIYSINSHHTSQIENKEKTTNNLTVIDHDIVYNSNYFYFRNYFHGGELIEIPIIDTTSIKMYSKRDYFAIDGVVYYQGKRIENADFESFQTFRKGHAVEYAKDKNNVYASGKVLANANPKTVNYNAEDDILEEGDYVWKWSKSENKRVKVKKR